MALSPDQLTQREMKERGYHIVRVEHYQWFPGIDKPRKKDFLGFADYFCWNNKETVLVQTTSRSNHAARKNKILGKQTFIRWVKNPNHKVLVQSWDKYKGKHRYRDEYLTLEMAELAKKNKAEQEEKETAHMKNWTAADFEKALHG